MGGVLRVELVWMCVCLAIDMAMLVCAPHYSGASFTIEDLVYDRFTPKAAPLLVNSAFLVHFAITGIILIECAVGELANTPDGTKRGTHLVTQCVFLVFSIWCFWWYSAPWVLVVSFMSVVSLKFVAMTPHTPPLSPRRRR